MTDQISSPPPALKQEVASAEAQISSVDEQLQELHSSTLNLEMQIEAMEDHSGLDSRPRSRSQQRLRRSRPRHTQVFTGGQ